MLTYSMLILHVDVVGERLIGVLSVECVDEGAIHTLDGRRGRRKAD